MYIFFTHKKQNNLGNKLSINLIKLPYAYLYLQITV